MRQSLCFIILLIFATIGTWAHGLSPERIVVVANQADEQSLEIAHHYLEKRQIPRENLILLTTSTDEDISWDAFLETMFRPLQDQLFADGWLSGSLSDTQDTEGRRKVVLLDSRIDFLVVCRLPLRIKNDAQRLEAAPKKPPQKQFLVNQGSTDGELALIAKSNTPTVSFVPNPLYGKLNPPTVLQQQIVRVARLDGPTVAAAKGLVDNALIAESKGLRGRAYMDLGGPHAKGDDWMRKTGEILEAMHFPTTWNESRAAFDFSERFDAPAFYFGWWKYNITGPIRERDFRFAPGAIGWHLHSFSAASIRRDNFRWTGPLVQRGLTATVGNVFEPYLELTHHPHVFMQALVRGKSTGEAAYMSLPALSWMAIFIGDPLYQPFKVDLKEQLAALEKNHLGDPLSEYVALREQTRIQAMSGNVPALKYGQQAFHRAPGLALGYANASLAKAQARRQDAVDALKFASVLPPIFDANQQGLALLCSQLLWDLGAREDAFKLMDSLMHSTLPEAAESTFLPIALKQARSLSRLPQIQEWTQLQNELKEKERARQEAQKK